MKVSFIAMDAAAMQSNITVTEEDIAAYYDQTAAVTPNLNAVITASFSLNRSRS